jgi:hypothetical protein
MKRILATLAPLALAACGGTGTLNLAVTSDATNTNALTAAAALPAPASPPSRLDLSNVESIKLTVAEVDVHLAGSGAPATVVPGKNDPPDNDGGWHQIDLVDTSGLPVSTIDLVIARGTPTSLGTIQLPSGKITQIRLKLQVDAVSLAEPGFDTITGAVQIAPVPPSTTPTFCDLAVPHSAVDPGVKIVGPFSSIQIDEGGTANVLLNFKLNELPPAASGTSACLYKLAPVLKIEKVDRT